MQCRVCLQSNCSILVEMDLLVSDEGETLYDYFNACTQLSASANDGFPNTLCSKCTKKLQIAFDFRKSALLSNEEFIQILKLPMKKTVSLELYDSKYVEEQTIDPLEVESSESQETTEQRNKVLVETSNDIYKLISENSYEAETILKDAREENGTISNGQLEYLIQDESCNIKDDFISGAYSESQASTIDEVEFLSQTDDDSDSNATASCQCEYCGEEFSTTGELHDHIKKHLFKCPFCTKICIDLSYYQKHLKRLHSNNVPAKPVLIEGAEMVEDKRIYCTLCNMVYGTLGAYRRHAVKSHGFDLSKRNIKKERNKSNFLQTKIRDADLKETHYNTKIKKKKSFLCSFCPRVLLSRGGLAQHEAKQHLKIEPELNQCPFCGKTFKRDYLGKHMDVVHNEERKFKCDICGRMFKTQHVAARHRLLHNPKDHSFSCSVCDKRFTEKSALNVHMRLHTGEMPFSCNICDRRFRIRGHLTYHLKLHVNAKHKCDVCEKEFKHPKSLQNHLYVHTGVMPYTCTICDYGNVKREYFTKHMLQKHNIEMTAEELFEMYRSNTGRPLFAKRIERMDVLIEDFQIGATRK